MIYLLVVVGLIINFSLPSSAVFQEPECTEMHGVCKNVNVDHCPKGRYVDNKCPRQGSNIKCCVTVIHKNEKFYHTLNKGSYIVT